MFQFSFNFESSVKLSFQQNFLSVGFTWYKFSSWLSFNFTFISWETSCLFEILIRCSRSNCRNLFTGYSFLPLQSGPQILNSPSEGTNSSSQQIVVGRFLVLYCLGLLLPFLLWPNQVPHMVSLIFFLEINSYNIYMYILMSIYIHISVHVYIQIYIYTHLYINTYTYICTYLYKYQHTYILTHTHLVDLRVTAIKRYSRFPKASALL